jgi:D-alanyl-D-alanine carboxypeptidase
MTARARCAAVVMPIACLLAGQPLWHTESSHGPVQLDQTARLDSYVVQRMRARRIPGLALAVVERGKPALLRAYGVANLITNTPVETASIFQLASLTKQFTAAAVMLLVEQGKVRLDDPISAYIDRAPQSWSKITVRHLLTHTSGISPGAIVRVDAEGKLTTRQGIPILDMPASLALDVIGQAPLICPAGERIMYCDACYFLLGLVIQKAAGQPYDEFVEKRLFEPLHMNSSSMLDRWKLVKGSVPVYTIRNGELAPWRRDWQYEVNAFAGILSTVGDLVKWDAALRDRTLLKPESFEAMWTPAKLNDGTDAVLFGEAYGFGWTLGELRGHRTVEHAGASGTYILHFLDDSLTIIVLTNLEGPCCSQPAVLARGIAGLVRPQYQPPDMIAPQADPSPQTTREVETLLRDMAEERDSPAMTAAHRAFYNGIPGPMRQDDAQLLKTLKSLTYVANDDVAGRGLKRLGEPIARIAYYRGELGGRMFSFTFWLTAEGKVASLRFYPV